MKFLRYGCIITVVFLSAFAAMHGVARADVGATSGGANCSVTNTALASLIPSYSPFTAPQTLTIPANTIAVSCSGANNQTVRVYVSGSATGYAMPFLAGPNGFHLNYNLCVPGASSCNATTNVWNTTTGFYQFTTQANNGLHDYAIGSSFSVYVPQQDAPYGSTSQYTGSLYFTTTCNGLAC